MTLYAKGVVVKVTVLYKRPNLFDRSAQSANHFRGRKNTSLALTEVFISQ